MVTKKPILNLLMPGILCGIFLTMLIFSFIHIFSTNTAPLPAQTAVSSTNIAFTQAAHVDVSYNTNAGAGTITVLDVQNMVDVSGTSMNPTLWTGNKCFTIAFHNLTQINEGQLVVFADTADEGTLKLHRVDAVYAEYILTRGDNTRSQEKVYAAQIKGIVGGCFYT